MQAATQYDEPLSDDLNLGALDRLTHSYLSSRFMEERLALPPLRERAHRDEVPRNFIDLLPRLP